MVRCTRVLSRLMRSFSRYASWDLFGPTSKQLISLTSWDLPVYHARHSGIFISCALNPAVVTQDIYNSFNNGSGRELLVEHFDFYPESSLCLRPDNFTRYTRCIRSFTLKSKHDVRTVITAAQVHRARGRVNLAAPFPPSLCSCTS